MSQENNTNTVKLNDVLFNDIFYPIKNWERSTFIIEQLEFNYLYKGNIYQDFADAFIEEMRLVVGDAVDNKDAGWDCYNYARTPNNKGFFMYPTFDGTIPCVADYNHANSIDGRTLGLFATMKTLRKMWLDNAETHPEVGSELYEKLRTLLDLVIHAAANNTIGSKGELTPLESTEIANFSEFIQIHM